jgi:uncharacterized membrane protein
MNFVHLHLLLNHVPTVGTIIAFGVLLLALMQKSDDLLRGAFALFFAIALVSLPTYMTGYSAEAVVKERPGVNLELIALHQSSALLALTLHGGNGRRRHGLDCGRHASLRGRSKWAVPSVLLLSVVTISLMANAANIGGEITHPEILAPGPAAGRGGGCSRTRVTAQRGDQVLPVPSSQRVADTGGASLHRTVAPVRRGARRQSAHPWLHAQCALHRHPPAVAVGRPRVS